MMGTACRRSSRASLPVIRSRIVESEEKRISNDQNAGLTGELA